MVESLDTVILPPFSQLPYHFATNEPQSGVVYEGLIPPLQTTPGTPDLGLRSKSVMNTQIKNRHLRKEVLSVFGLFEICEPSTSRCEARSIQLISLIYRRCGELSGEGQEQRGLADPSAGVQEIR